MTEIVIGARQAAAALNLELLELAMILRRTAAEKLEVAARVVAREDGVYGGWDEIENLLAGAVACETSWYADNPTTEED